MKILHWILLNGATLLGCVQAIVKAIKELLTGVVNLVSLFVSREVTEKLVAVVRNALNIVDDVIEKVKGYLIK